MDQKRQQSHSSPEQGPPGRRPFRKILVCFPDQALAEGHVKEGADCCCMVPAVPGKRNSHVHEVQQEAKKRWTSSAVSSPNGHKFLTNCLS